MIDTVNLRDSYKFYRKDNKDVLLLDYLDIVNGLMKYIMKKVLDGFDVRLGAKLGVIGIRGRKVVPLINDNGEIKNIAPDWGATKKLQRDNEEAKQKRTIIYCFNEHSNGIKYKFFWAKAHVIMTNKTYYGLTFFRANRRELSRKIKNGKEYLVVDNKT